MSNNDEKFLAANGIVRSENNELRCFLCTTDENSRDWHSHVENSQHLTALKQFRLIFVINGERIDCKACNSLIDWAGVKNHAMWHKIVPWYEIKNENKIFFDNRILNVNSSFDCLLCKVKFVEHSRALAHISEDAHKKSMFQQPPLHEIFNPHGTSYELLITEGFEPWGLTSVKCKVCDCPNVDLKSLSEHVESADHISAKKNFSSGFKTQTNAQGETDVKMSSGLVSTVKQNYAKRSHTPTGYGRYNQWNGIKHRSLSIDRSPTQKVYHKYIDKSSGPKVRQDSTNFPVEKRAFGRFCTICEIVVDTDVDVHVSGEKHTTMLRHYGHEFIEPIDEYTFRCTSCKCKVPNLENVYRHIKGSNHRNQLRKMPEVVPKVVPKVVPEVVPEKKEDEKTNKTISFKMNFPPPPPSMMHLQQTGVGTVRTAGANNPRSIGPNVPYAPRMDIPRFPPAFLPLIVPQPVRMPYQHQIVPNLPQKPAGNLTKSAWETLPRDYIVVQNSRDLFCRICDCAIYGHNNVDDHINGTNHQAAVKEFCATISLHDNDVYYCKKCKQEIQSRDNLYLHMSGRPHIGGTKNEKISGNNTFNENSSKQELAGKSNVSEEKTSKPENVPSVPSDDCIVILGKVDFCCKICHQILCDRTKIAQHLDSPEHAKSILLYKRAGYKGNEHDGKYYCKFCSCTIPNFANVPLHTIGLKHRNAISGKETIFSPPSHKIVELARYFIGFIDEDTYYCRICNVSLFGEAELNHHKGSNTHAQAVDKYGCFGIMMTKNHQYDCQYCKCRIPELENIFVHVSGKRHLQYMLNIELAKTIGCSPEKTQRPGATDSLDSEDKHGTYFSCGNIKTPLGESSTNDTAKNISDEDDRRKVSCQPDTANTKKAEDSWMEENIPSGSKTDANVISRVNQSDPPEWERMIDMILIDTERGSRPKSEKQRMEETTSSDESRIDEKSRFSSEREQSSSDSKLSSDENPYRNVSSSVINEDCNETASHKRSSNETLATADGDISKMRSLASSTLSLSGRKRRTPRAADLVREQNIFNIDYIYEMKDKLRELERSTKLCVIKESNDIYCLICRKKVADTPQSCVEHFWSLEHCEFLEGMEKDHALFEVVSGQYSELDLATQYLEETSEDLIYCHVCNIDIDNIDFTLKDHMAEEVHEEKCREMLRKAEACFHDAKSTIRCDWYKIYKYWCVFCSSNFDSELGFAKHLKSSVHSSVMKKMANNHKGTMYDYCLSCTLLWCGYRSTYANHVEIPAHKWLLKDEDQTSPKLPTSVKCLLNMPHEYIQDSIKYLDEVFAKDCDKEESLIRDLEKTARLYFPDATATTFGSKVAGLESGENGIEVFLDCKDKRHVESPSKNTIASLKTRINECLNHEQTLWHTEGILTKGSAANITALHRPTGISCDIHFDAEISVITTKLIKSVNDKLPVYRKIVIFLKPWLEFSDLYGPEKITLDALSWLVIFYLQRESLLPKIAECIEPAKKSNLTAGWAINVNAFSCIEESNGNIKQLLGGFFQFYANFDYRCDVACPLIAQTLKKQDFASPENLPEEMKPYTDYLTNSNDPEAFGVELPMCLQNPLSLVDNLTKNISKVQMNRFRTYCFKSLDILDAVPS